MFQSPHLESFVERFRIGGRELGGPRLADAVSALRPHIDALRRATPQNAPTFFDALCAIALRVFAEEHVDACVLEVGLGGRLDSTNAVDPRCTCITSIELEHTDMLGDTHAAIAGEKAGILKPGVPLVLGAVSSEAEAVIRDRARALGVPVTQAGVDFELEDVQSGPEGVRARFRCASLEVPLALPVPGEHHAHNAALALAMVQRMYPERSDLEAIAARGFASLRLPARAECVGRAPLRVVDAAHTEASARALAQTLESVGVEARSVHFVLSVSAGKDLAPMVEAWLPFAARFTLTRALAARSLEPVELEAAIRARSDRPIAIVPDPEEALRGALAEASPADALCATGSFFLAGIARRIWTEA